ncbi:MAG: PIG-L family deacetylase [Clostridia bacterium]|nr:PIG-L family deacetylase [Clostridia bacterium]
MSIKREIGILALCLCLLICLVAQAEVVSIQIGNDGEATEIETQTAKPAEVKIVETRIVKTKEADTSDVPAKEAEEQIAEAVDKETKEADILTIEPKVITTVVRKKKAEETREEAEPGEEEAKEETTPNPEPKTTVTYTPHWEGAETLDISEHCLYNGRAGGPHHPLNDGAYNYPYETAPRSGVHYIEITVTDGEPMGALYIQWEGDPVPLAVQVPDGEEWETIVTSDGDFYAEYISFPPCRECRIVGRDNPGTPMSICEMRVLTEGKPAENIQLWQKPEGKIDLMLIAGHPDDELLWFGGALPYYAGELKKNTLVITCAMSVRMRRLELCDALWACGVRIHPIYLHLRDFSDTDVRKVLHTWHAEEKVLGKLVGYIRQFQPDVLLLHDVNGEYGHGIHRAASWLGRECIPLAADPEVEPASAAEYGTWEVKKAYIHLWPENQITMDWKRPLTAFGGLTGLEAAQQALDFHKSQVVHGWEIEEGGEYDNSLFGLYHSTVGADVIGDDFFENIE